MAGYIKVLKYTLSKGRTLVRLGNTEQCELIIIQSTPAKKQRKTIYISSNNKIINV